MRPDGRHDMRRSVSLLRDAMHRCGKAIARCLSDRPSVRLYLDLSPYSDRCIIKLFST